MSKSTQKPSAFTIEPFVPTYRHMSKQDLLREARRDIPFNTCCYSGAWVRHVPEIERLWRLGLSNHDIHGSLNVGGMPVHTPSAIVTRCVPEALRSMAERRVFQARRAEMLTVRQDGMTFKEIGAAFGITASQARAQIDIAGREEKNRRARAGSVLSAEKDAETVDPDLIALVPNAYLIPVEAARGILSIRALNTLKNNRKIWLGDIVTTPLAELRRTPNCGKDTLAEIVLLLQGIGIEPDSTDKREPWLRVRAELIRQRQLRTPNLRMWDY